MMLLVNYKHVKHVVLVYELDNGYPSTRDDRNVLPGKSNEHQQ
jgi:hypothetical protein